MVSSCPIFAASDIEATLEYYEKVLGFGSTWKWGDPPTFGGANCGGTSIMFGKDPELAARVKGHQHWIKVEDADALHADHVARGAKIVDEIADREWGVREYGVEDVNGYHLRFAGPPSTEAPKSQPFPEGVRLERGTPLGDEFERVAGGSRGILEQTWNGVTARTSDGEAIGVLRIMHDGPGWFSIWDVAVVPEWQAKRIGSKMMEEAMAMVREDSPGAWVFLFTSKQGFYERLGFGVESVSMRRV